MVANLFGDFIKGRNYSYLPPIVQDGVFLHRQIDDYIDHHPLVTELRLYLYQELPKIAGIAIDLYFDHLLAKNWSKYHSQPLDDFINEFLHYIQDKSNLKFVKSEFEYPSNFNRVLTMIEKHNLLKKYVHIDGLKMASEGLSKRISFDNNLYMAPAVYLNNEKKIETAFHLYMEDAILRFK